VDEMSAYLTGTHGRDGTMEISFVIDDDQIQIQGSGDFAPGQKIRTDLTDFSRVILETVVDEASLEHADGSPVFNLIKSKRK
jgi:hypothetical protein